MTAESTPAPTTALELTEAAHATLVAHPDIRAQQSVLQVTALHYLARAARMIRQLEDSRRLNPRTTEGPA